MDRGKVEVQTVKDLARLAGFDFAPERCELLVEQLDWILKEAARVESVDREGFEPVNIFQPGLWHIRLERETKR